MTLSPDNSPRSYSPNSYPSLIQDPNVYDKEAAQWQAAYPDEELPSYDEVVAALQDGLESRIVVTLAESNLNDFDSIVGYTQTKNALSREED